MNKTRSNLRFKEFAKAAAAGAFVGAIALQPVVTHAATGSVPVQQAGAKWFVNTNISFSSTSSQWGLSEASLHTAGAATANSYNRDDSYDGVFAWHVFSSAPSGATSANGYRDPGGIVSTDTSYGTTLTGSVQVLAGLNVSGQMYFSPTKPVVRTMLILQNPTGAPLSVVVGNYNNLGSDSATTIIGTSSGDATFDATDNWFVSCQESVTPGTCDSSLDPVITFALQDAAPTSVRATNIGPVFANGNDNPNFDYNVTVPAGATRRVIIFGQLSDTAAHAQADAPLFNSSASLNGTDYLHGLTAQQLSEVVNWKFQSVPAITVTGTPNPSTVGQSVAFTATLTNGSAPTGTVTICADDATCTAPVASCTATVAGTTATCSISTLSVGSHSITAKYSGDTLNTAATSAPLTEQVSAHASTTSLAASPNPAQSGQAVSLVATVTGAAPTGTVSFYDGAALLGSSPVNGSGQATFSTGSLSAGAHSLTAVYSGDANNATSTSAAVVEAVEAITSPVPTLGGWALLLLGGLLGLIGRIYARARNSAVRPSTPVA